MAAPREKSFCVLEYHTSKSVVNVQLAFRDRVFIPPLPRDLTDLKARIIAALKNIDAPTLTCVCGKNLNVVSMCAVSPVVHTSNISRCQKKLSQFSCGCEQFKLRQVLWFSCYKCL
jgi:hypothetical protein